MRTTIGVVLGVVLLAGLLTGCATALGGAVEQGDIKVVKALLDQGADVNEREACGKEYFEPRTPLMCAAATGNIELAKLLLDRGAQVNAKAIHRHTALDFAVRFGHVQMVRLLLEHGADTNSGGFQNCEYGVLDNRTCTTIEYAKHTGKTTIARLLEEAEARQLGTVPQVASPSMPAAPPPPAAGVLLSDVDIPPARRAKARSRAYAVVIGIESYREQLPKADFGAQDAKTVGVYLTKVMGYSEENVATLVNERATRTDIEKYVESWLPNRVEKDDTVFVYFSGHGAPNPKTGDAYLVPYDGDPAFVDKTGYPVRRLYEQLGKLPAKEIVVMLDSCFSGAGGRSVIAPGARPMVLTVENPLLASGKMVVLAASAGDQISSTYKQKGHGLLTYFFLKGLQGEADANKDGSVDLSELFAYVRPQVSRVARRDFNNDQQPQLLGSPDLLSKDVRLTERAQ